MKIVYCSIVVFITSCIGDGKTASQREYLKNLKDNPLTNKELNFQDSLKKMNYTNIKFDAPIIGYVCQGCSSYIVQMDCPFDLLEKNKDSVRQINLDMAKFLYSSVIEDSIIYDFGEIRIEYNVAKSEIKDSKKYLEGSYSKGLLEKTAGFKVIESNKGTFERVKE